MLQSEQILVTVGEVARKGAIVLSDDFARPDQTGLGSTPAGVAWKNQAAAFFSIATGAAVKQTGTATTRYFAMLPCSTTGDLILSAQVTTNPATNLTDTGLMVRSLDSTATRGGQLYVSIRKTSTANSVRVLHRTDTSGSDTVLVQNTTAGWADGTTYNVQVVLSGDSIDVLRDGASIIGGPFILTSGVRATLGTDVGISFTNTDTGSRIESLQVWDPNYVETPPATPTATTVRVIAHRGTLASAGASTENSIAGLDILAGLRRPVSGIEWDVRVSSDGELFLMHDETGARTHPAMGATGVEGYTASQLDGFGVTRLTAGLAACAGRGFERINLQHYFPGSATAALNKLLTQIAASPVASRVKIMTSISGPYAPVQIRAAGWSGPIGTYGSTAANYAGSGDGKAADFPASSIGWAYLPPGGYSANRAHVATLQGAGILVGASTENSSTTWGQAHSDGISEVLTDQADQWLALYEPPPAAYDATATLTGTGALTGVTSPSTTRAAGLTGVGSLTGTAASAVPVAATLTGTGTMTGTSAPSFTAAGPLTGFGTLTATGTPARSASAGLTGAGALQATTTPASAVAGGLTGTGTFSGTSAPAMTASAGMTGTGTLAGSSTAAVARSAALTGTGTLTSSATPAPTAAAPLTGAGSLVASAGSDVIRSASLTGTGTLTGTSTPAVTRSTALTGTGTLSTTTVQAITTTATLSGSGTLTTVTTPAPAVTAAFTGSGALTATAAQAPGTVAALTGAGALTATSAKAVGVATSLTGTGNLAAATRAGLVTQASLNGTGALTATAVMNGDSTNITPPIAARLRYRVTARTRTRVEAHL